MTEQQKMQRDSLELYFKISNDDYAPYQQRLDNTEKALAIVNKLEKDSMYRVYMFRVANRYFNIRNYTKYKNTTDLIIKNSIKENDTFSLAKGYSYLGDYCDNICPDSAYSYYNEAIKLFIKINDNPSIAKTLLSKAEVLYYHGDLIESESSVIYALKYLRIVNDDELTYRCYNILGAISVELAEYQKALKYHTKALSIANLNTIDVTSQLKATSLNNIGYLYRLMEKYPESIHYFKEALKEKNIKKDCAFLYAMLKDNLAYSQFKIKVTKEVPALFYEALKIRDSLQISAGIISSSINLSEYYAFKEDTTKSIIFERNAYRLSIKHKKAHDALLSLKQLSNILPREKIVFMEEYFKINDSLQLAERKNRNKFARIEYETEELEIEKASLQTQKTSIIYIAVALLLLLIAIIIIRYQCSKNRELQHNQQQQKANSEIYRLMLDQQKKIEEGKQIEKKRISKELHDGVMGRLTSIRLNLFVLSKKTDKETIDKCLHHISEIQNIEKEIRNIAYDLGKNIFSDNINFETVVKNLFAEIESHSEIHFELNTDEQIDWEMVDINIKMQIYRVLQEALQNIDKYAQAKNVIINMQKMASDINVIITDDGIGFEKSKIKKGFGLKNMKDRIKTINGKITIRSAVGEGTTINVVVPVPEDYFVAV